MSFLHLFSGSLDLDLEWYVHQFHFLNFFLITCSWTMHDCYSPQGQGVVWPWQFPANYIQAAQSLETLHMKRYREGVRRISSKNLLSRWSRNYECYIFISPSLLPAWTGFIKEKREFISSAIWFVEIDLVYFCLGCKYLFSLCLGSFWEFVTFLYDGFASSCLIVSYLYMDSNYW